MNGIPWDVVTSKAVNSTITELMMPIFILLAQIPESFHAWY
jgi:hypothetical protein